jgi:uncharacterized membrane protein
VREWRAVSGASPGTPASGGAHSASGAGATAATAANGATPATAEPAQGRRLAGRYVGVDLARGLALFGMMATHTLPLRDPETGELTWVGLLFDGRASALFAVLAGLSLALVSGRTTPYAGPALRRARIHITVRAFAIGFLGLLLVELDPPIAVILAYYALFFLAVLPFLGMRPGALAWLALAWGLVAPQLSHVLRQRIDDPVREQVGLSTVFLDPLGSMVELLLTGYYPVLVWVTYLLAGMAVGRLDLRRTTIQLWLLLGGAALGAGSWLISTALLVRTGGPPAAEVLAERLPTASVVDLQSAPFYGTTPPRSAEWLLVAAPHSGTTFDLATTIGSAFAVLGACLLLTRLRPLAILTYPVAAAGTMTLTLYTVHAVYLALTREQWGEPAYYWTQVIAAMVFATVWTQFVRRGPLEGGLHALTTAVASSAVPAPRRG